MEAVKLSFDVCFSHIPNCFIIIAGGHTLQLLFYILIDQAELRNKLIDRVDVLNKVKELFLIPKFNMMTTKMVAEYYGVEINAVKTVYKRHKDELDSDGMQCILSSELSEVHFVPLKIDHRIMKGTVRGSTAFDIDGYTLEIRNGYNTFFTPRAVLRIGMLLRDSEVAKEVRTQLLKNEKTYSALALYNPPLYSSSRYNHPKDKEMERQGKRDEWGSSSVRDSLFYNISLYYLYWAILVWFTIAKNKFCGEISIAKLVGYVLR